MIIAIVLLSVIVAALLYLNYQVYINFTKPREEEKRLEMAQILHDYERIQKEKAVEDFKKRNKIDN